MPQDFPINRARAAFTSDYLYKRFAETYFPSIVRSGKDGFMQRDVQPGIDFAFPIDLDLLKAALDAENTAVVPPAPPPPDDTGSDSSDATSDSGSDSTSESDSGASDSGGGSDSASGSDSGGDSGSGASDSGDGSGGSDTGSDSSSSGPDSGGGDIDCTLCGGINDCTDRYNLPIPCPETNNGSSRCGCSTEYCSDKPDFPNICDECFGSYCSNMTEPECPTISVNCCYADGSNLTFVFPCCSCH